MQNVQSDVPLVGARGWTWRVERRERAGAREQIVHLSRPRDDGATTLVAISPHEPASTIAAATALVEMPAPHAAALVRRAMTAERRAFALHAAERLRGDIHDWQLAPAIALARGHARVLVADEAGMGKTTAAAIAIAQCLQPAAERRCLVLAPGHLLRQWQDELRDRLSIDAVVLDAAGMARMQQELPAGMSPWALDGCLLASMDFVKQPHLMRSLDRLAWDLLVVDEAHLASGTSERHDAVHRIARRARQVLLLTATPSDGGDERLRALMQLGAPGGDRPVVWLRHSAAARCRRERTIAVAPAEATRQLHGAVEEYARWIESGPAAGDAIPLLAALLTKRAQSSPRALVLSLQRRRALLGTIVTPVQGSLFGDEGDDGIIGAATGRPVESERDRIDALIDLGHAALLDDRRVRALARLLHRRHEPVVIFSSFRDTAAFLADALGWRRVRLMHGAMPGAAIDTALDDFRYGRADTLVATDVASQGLNLHHRCRWVIHYDLPWRPPAMAQRIGRVDRLGQSRRVHSTVLIDRTPLALALHARLEALRARMQMDERSGARRWDVLARHEARRIDLLRSPARAVAGLTAPAVATIVEIEIGSGLERRVFALACDVDWARRWCEQWAQVRCAQLRGRLARRAERRRAREVAVHQALNEAASAAPRQTGLFDRRADRDRALDGDARREYRLSLERALDGHARESQAAVTSIRIVATFT